MTTTSIQLQSDHLDQWARNIAISQGQQIDTYQPEPIDTGMLDSMAQQIAGATEIPAYEEYLLRTQRYLKPITGPDGQSHMRENTQDYLKQQHEAARNRYLGSITKEALAAEGLLLPGMVMLAGETVFKGLKYLPGGTGMAEWTMHRIDPPKEEELKSPDGGTDDLPLSYKILMPYYRIYDEMVDAEADLMIATQKLYESEGEETGLLVPGISAAVGHTGANIATGVANPAGKVAKIGSKALGVTARGLIWGTTAFVGSKALRKVLGKSLKGDAKAVTSLGKSWDLMAGVGRGNPVVDGAQVANSIAEAQGKRLAMIQQGSNLAPDTMRINKIMTDFRLTRQIEERASREATEILPNLPALAPAHIFNKTPADTPRVKYLSKEDMVSLRKAELDDQRALSGLPPAMHPPTITTNLYLEAKRIASRIDVPASTADKAKAAKKVVDEITSNEAIADTPTGKLLVKAGQEIDKTAKAEGKAPGTIKRWIASVTDPIWQKTGVAAEAHRVAKHYVANRDSGMLDAAINYQRMKQDIPDRAVRQDMIAFLEETGNGWKGADDTYQDVVARLKGTEYMARAVEWKKHLRTRFDAMWKEINELNAEIGDKAVDYADDWLHHMWIEPVQEAQEKIGRIRNRQLPVTAKLEKHRYFESVRDGMLEGGLTPRSMDIAETYALVEAQYSRAMATKKLIKDLNELAISDSGERIFLRVMDGAAVPKGYVRFRSAFTDRIARDGLPESIIKNSEVVVHEDGAKHLRNILEQPEDLNAFYKLSAMAKRANFMFAFFHMYSLGESSIALLNPVRGMKVNAKIAQNMFRKDWYTGDAFNSLVNADSFRDAFEQAAYAGVKVGVPMHDVMRDQFERAMREGVQRGTKGNPKAMENLEKIFGVQHKFDELVWEKYHTPMKVIAYDLIYNQLKAVKDGVLSGKKVFNPLKKGIAEMDDEMLSEQVAKYINDEFGGQNWEIATQGWAENVLSKPKNLRMLAAIFTSVDWNVSSIKAGLGFMQAVPGLKSSNAVKGFLGIKHWRNASMGYLFYANLMNKALSGHYIYENEPGKRIFHMDTGERDDKGKPIYLNVGKQFRELPGFMGVELQMDTERGSNLPLPGKRKPSGMRVEFNPLAGTGLFLSRKTMPWVQSFITAPEEFWMLTKEFERDGKELGLSDSVQFAFQQFGEGFMPFSIGGALGNTALEDVPFEGSGIATRAAAAVLPASRGKNDSWLVQQLIMRLRAGDRGQFTEMATAIAESRGQDKASELVNEAYNKLNAVPQTPEKEGTLAPKPSPLRKLLD